MAAEKQPAGRNAARFGKRLSQEGAIGGGARPRRRAARPPPGNARSKRKTQSPAAQNAAAVFAMSGELQVAAGAMGHRQSGFALAVRPVQKAADVGSLDRNGLGHTAKVAAGGAPG